MSSTSESDSDSGSASLAGLTPTLRLVDYTDDGESTVDAPLPLTPSVCDPDTPLGVQQWFMRIKSECAADLEDFIPLAQKTTWLFTSPGPETTELSELKQLALVWTSSIPLLLAPLCAIHSAPECWSSFLRRTRHFVRR